MGASASMGSVATPNPTQQDTNLNQPVFVRPPAAVPGATPPQSPMGGKGGGTAAPTQSDLYAENMAKLYNSQGYDGFNLTQEQLAERMRQMQPNPVAGPNPYGEPQTRYLGELANLPPQLGQLLEQAPRQSQLQPLPMPQQPQKPRPKMPTRSVGLGALASNLGRTGGRGRRR